MNAQKESKRAREESFGELRFYSLKKKSLKENTVVALQYVKEGKNCKNCFHSSTAEVQGGMKAAPLRDAQCAISIFLSIYLSLSTVKLLRKVVEFPVPGAILNSTR